MSKVLSVRPTSYALAIAMVTAATFATQWLRLVLDDATYIVFDAVAAVVTWYGGRNAGLLTVVLSVLAIDIFLFSPQQMSIWQMALSTVVPLLMVFLTSELQRTRQQVQQLSDRPEQHQEAHLQRALQSAQVGIWHWDLVSGQVTWSLEHEALFGLAPKTFDGRYATFEACVYERDRDRLNQVVQQSIRHRTDYQHEFRVVWPDGNIHWIEGRGQTAYNEVGQPIYITGTVTNIDHRKQAEFDLQRYEQMLAITPDLIALVDRTYRYQLVNRAYLRRFQKRYEQVIGQPVAAIVGSQVFETACQSPLDRALAGERVHTYLWYDFPIAKHRHLKVSYIPCVESDHTISGVIVSIRDLTDLQRAEAELQQNAALPDFATNASHPESAFPNKL